MAAFDYASLIARLLSILRDDERLVGVHVTDEPDAPTAEQCPAVQIAMVGFDRTPRRIVARRTAGQPYDETIALLLRCMAFSGQSAADARRQCQDLVRLVESVLDDWPTLNDTVQTMDIRSGSFTEAPQDDGSLYSAVTLRVDVQVLV